MGSNVFSLEYNYSHVDIVATNLNGKRKTYISPIKDPIHMQ